MVAGTLGYNDVIETFAEASFKLKFEEINQDFLRFLPHSPSRVLDAGAGVGQNSAALARLGYDVVAIEPLCAFRQLAISNYPDLNISWLNDSLPMLENSNLAPGSFHFILLDGVWHHLDHEERELSIKKFSSLLANNGICAISLRNGPAGAGKHVFPTSSSELIQYAEKYNFHIVLHVEHQPSQMPNKKDVIWSRIAMQKIG